MFGIKRCGMCGVHEMVKFLTVLMSRWFISRETSNLCMLYVWSWDPLWSSLHVVLCGFCWCA